MKRIVLAIVFLFFTTAHYAQSNSVKGRIFGVPEYFTMGIGYERMLNDKTSVQLLFNRFGYDLRDTDGQAEFTNSLVPEFRYFFGKKKKESINKAAYLGLFTEISKTEIFPGGEQFGEKIFTGGYKKKINPGILIGRNTQIAKRWYAEFYLGVKYKFLFESNDYYHTDSQSSVTESSSYSKAGIRLGINIGFRF